MAYGWLLLGCPPFTLSKSHIQLLIHTHTAAIISTIGVVIGIIGAKVHGWVGHGTSMQQQERPGWHCIWRQGPGLYAGGESGRKPATGGGSLFGCSKGMAPGRITMAHGLLPDQRCGAQTVPLVLLVLL